MTVTYCPNGHPLEGDTATGNPNGYRRCKVCRCRLVPRTHCKEGHELTDDNVFVVAGGHRRCRTCHAAQQRANRLRVLARAPQRLNEQRRAQRARKPGCPHAVTAPYPRPIGTVCCTCGRRVA